MTHDQLIELIPLTAIDAVSEAERSEILLHIEGCPACTRLMADYEQVADALLRNTPAMALASNLELSLKGRVHALQSASAPRRAPARETRNFWQKTLALPRWAALGIAAALAILLIVSAWTIVRPQSTQSAEAAELATLLRTPGTWSAKLKGTDREPSASGEAILNAQFMTTYLIVNNLPALPPQQTYQVWLVRESTRDNGGLFSVDAKGHAALLVKAPLPLSQYQEIGVTIEPAGGSPWPTTTRVVGVTLK